MAHHMTELNTWSDERRAVARPRRILIAEDETSVRDFVDCVLRDAGYLTSRVVDGQEALDFAERFGPFDLLLTDLVMPRVDGVELARRLRKHEPHLKVLYFTGYSDRLFADKGRLWVGEAFLDKPATINALLEAVSLLLDGRTSPPEAKRRRH